MKTFPILIEKENKTDVKFIEWKIHNVCNNDCSFCHSSHKDGSNRWLTLAKYKEYVDKLVLACEGKPFWFQITGGEPTLFPELLDLMKYMKEKGAWVSLISNGSRTLRWWQELKESKAIDYLCLTYHSEQTTDYKHNTEVINLFHDEPVETISLITHVVRTIDLAFEAQKYFLENTGAIVNVKAMIMGEYDIYSLYTDEQLKKLRNENWLNGSLRDTKVKPSIPDEYKIDHKLKITLNDGSHIKANPQQLMKNKENYFLGWDCSIGNFTMRVDVETIYRGVCGVGERTSITDEKISFTDDFIKCTSHLCYCGTDIIATKIRPKELYPEV